MDGCTAIHFVKHVKIGVCATWWHLQEFSQQSNNNASPLLCVLWENLDEDSFDMLYKNDSWAAIPGTIWTTNVPYERKINVLSSTDNNLWFVFLILRDLVMNLGFLFFLYSHCIKSRAWATTLQCEFKKQGNGDSILNLWKSKRKIMKLLSVDYSIFIFLSYGTLGVHIGSGMAAQQSFL